MKDLLADVNKLKTFETKFDKNEKVLLKHLSSYDETSYLTDLKRDLDQIRSTDLQNRRNEVKKIYKPLKGVEQLLNEDSTNFDLSQLKRELICMQDNIHNVKQSTQDALEKLINEETHLQNDLDSIEDKISSTEISVIPSKISLHPNNQTSSNLCPEVLEFNKFVEESGGHEHRWPLEDHNLFLKLRNKHKNEVELATKLHLLLPDISENHIMRHEMWYRKYLKIKEKKDVAIKKWRLERVNKVRTEKQLEHKPAVTVNKQTEINRDKLQEKISIWKEHKARKLKETNREKKKEQLKNKELQLKEKERQGQLKKQIELWKMSKDATKKKEEYEKKKEELIKQELKASNANKLIKAFQLQDKQYVEKMKHLRLRTNSLDRVDSVNRFEAERDPKRLLKPTKQWLYRTSSYEGAGTQSTVCFINSIQKLGVPEWRKAMK